jgi:hypothetical protein
MRERMNVTQLKAWWLAVLLVMAARAPQALKGQTTGEYDVKAAFLYHFAQFVEWPPEAFHDAKSPLTFCTIGDDPFRGALEESGSCRCTT